MLVDMDFNMFYKYIFSEFQFRGNIYYSKHEISIINIVWC